jgi:hypothetical protein
MKSTSADQGTPSKGTWSDKEKAEEGMETDTPELIKNEDTEILTFQCRMPYI